MPHNKGTSRTVESQGGRVRALTHMGALTSDTVAHQESSTQAGQRLAWGVLVEIGEMNVRSEPYSVEKLATSGGVNR